MRIQDISLHKRLLGANFLMVAVPVCAILLLGTVLLTALHFTGADQPASLALLWPERGPSFFVQYLTSDIRMRAQRAARKNKKLDVKDIIKDCQRLEEQGMQTVIWQKGKIQYVTAGGDAAELLQKAAARAGDSESFELWEGAGFIFRYHSWQHNTTIVAMGQLPEASAQEEGFLPLKRVLEITLWLFLLVSLGSIFLVGHWLSRTLSRQILAPLAELRLASAAIRAGDLERTLQVVGHDEVGMACADFEQMRKELRQTRQERVRYENNRKELIAGISHDLRTPLTAVKGYVSGIRDGIARTPEKKQHYLNMIYESILTLERLVESLFLFSKLDLGKVPFHLEPIALQDYLTEYFGGHENGTGEPAVEISVEGDAAGIFVAIDPLQFQRVIQNLWDNSRKYSREGKTEINVRVTQSERQIELSWQDHGKGVSEDQLPRLFDQFYRTDEARSNVADGSGLGLAVSKEIIRAMNGTIEARNTPGGGLTILIRLPMLEEKGDQNEKNPAD